MRLCLVFVQVGGKALAEAMVHNSTLTECDIRQTDIDETNAASINKAIWDNQCADWDKEVQQRRKSTIYL